MKIKFQIIIFLITISSYSQNSFPTYKEVVTKLYNQYNVDSLEQEKIISFEKRAAGWTVTVMDFSYNDTISELFWDDQKKQYLPINFPPKATNESDEESINRFLNSTPLINYNKLKFYGYVGWYDDIIQLYENKKELSDHELYSLGYAYSNYASGLLNDNFEFSNAKINFKLPISKNSMTNNQLNTYLSIENKSIKCYSELYQRNSKFETIPGQIGIKYYNEIASNFLNLRIYQNEEIAMKEIQGKDLYSDNYKMYAKNMLDSCDKDAILFTAGDNDTFPLLIYQVQNNYRKDVLIVNTSLLQDERYVVMMQNRVLDSDGIPLSINSNFIKDESSEALLFNVLTEDAISIENLNSIILDESNVYEGKAKTYKTIPSNNFKFNKNSQVLEWSISGEALYRSHLIMLDIIATNKWKRPIYFAINNSDDNYLGLSKYLQFEGEVYKLTNKEGIVSDEIGFVNTSKLEQNMKTMFQFKNKTNLPVEERQLVMDYRMIYNRLANYYIEQGDFKKAESILDESIKLYPNDLAYFSFDVLSIIESYYKVNSFQKSKLIQNQLLQNFKNKFDNYSFLSDEEKKAKYERSKKHLKSMNEYYKVE